MTGDISQLHDILNISGEYVSCAGGEKERSQMGIITNGVLKKLRSEIVSFSGCLEKEGADGSLTKKN